VVVFNEDGDGDDARAREGEGSSVPFGVSSMLSPIPPFGEGFGACFGLLIDPPLTCRLYSSKTIRDEYQRGPF